MTPDIATIERTGEDSLILTFIVPRDAEVFAGHFPGRPILAGVVQLDWAVALANEYLGVQQSIARDFQIKFRRVIGPDMGLSLILRRDRQRGSLSFEYRVGSEIASTGRIKLDSEC